MFQHRNIFRQLSHYPVRNQGNLSRSIDHSLYNETVHLNINPEYRTRPNLSNYDG
ncbi:hypothetical protein DPMN_104320 [Dreissena polymorpha]|uniref:Uncharacterized protein n=1 Tax=Dreissena polymorpha TaxID=45954 RepID=A0A9D4HCW0_DREPO|nr:hypothetical protein DPMN_104320 [Dreissena polymorpha]